MSSFKKLSGVPQGSNLGSLLFSLFMNDASLVLPPGTRLFYADDTKMIVESLDDCHHLQRLLNAFTTLSTKLHDFEQVTSLTESGNKFVSNTRYLVQRLNEFNVSVI